MRPELSLDDVKALVAVVTAITGKPVKEIHVNYSRICDCCQNADEEAFPCHVYSLDGRFWPHLCNDCFEALGCAYEQDAEVTP